MFFTTQMLFSYDFVKSGHLDKLIIVYGIVIFILYCIKEKSILIQRYFGLCWVLYIAILLIFVEIHMYVFKLNWLSTLLEI